MKNIDFLESRIQPVHLKWVYVLYALISFYAVYIHEPWRDEIQAFLLARDSHSIPNLYHNTRYEGHPMLWFLILYAIKHIHGGVWIIKIVHWMIINFSVILLMFRSKILKLWRILIPFGYYFIFEHNSIFRNYALGILFIFLALYCIERKKWWWAAISICLCFQSNVYAFIISSALWFFVFIYHIRSEPRKITLLSIIVLIGLLSTIYLTIPPSDYGYARGIRDIHWDRFWSFIDAMCRSYIILPKLDIGFWNTNVLGMRETSITGIILVLFVITYFLRFRRSFSFFIIATVLVGLFLSFKFMGYIRHQGHLYIVFITAIWIQSMYNNNHELYRFRIIFNSLIACIFILQIYSGGLALFFDTKYPFSQSVNAGAYIQNSKIPYTQFQIISNSHCCTSPILPYIQGDMYYPERKESGTFMIWDLKNDKNTSDSLMNELLKKGKCLLISPTPIEIRDSVIEQVYTLTPDICGCESYYFYQKKGFY